VQRKTKEVDLLERRNDPHYARLLDRPDSWFKHPSVSWLWTVSISVSSHIRDSH